MSLVHAETFLYPPSFPLCGAALILAVANSFSAQGNTCWNYSHVSLSMTQIPRPLHTRHSPSQNQSPFHPIPRSYLPSSSLGSREFQHIIMEPPYPYTRSFHFRQLGIKDPARCVSPAQVASYCTRSGLTLTTWFDDYNAFVDPTCIIVRIAGCFSTSSSSSSSAADSSSQGTYASNNTAQFCASTSYGIYHGPFSPHNFVGVVPACRPQSKPHADLYAAGMSLLQLHRLVLSPTSQAPQVRNIVLVTDSNYLVNCLTQSVYSWNLNGYKNAKKKEVANAGVVRWVERLVVGLETHGVGVKFWMVDRKENTEVMCVAKKVLEQEKLRESEFRVQLESRP